MLEGRSPTMDVSNRVDVTRPAAVGAEVRKLMEALYPGQSFDVIDTLFSDLKRLYEGDFPGYHACDVKYHDIQHVLDVTLAMARLIDGYEQSLRREALPEDDREPLGASYAIAGVCAALFHDAGYIRLEGDTQHSNGAAYTRVHVNRSARWLREYLPSVGLGHLAAPCARIVQFTNCSRDPSQLDVRAPAERVLGEFLGTADLIAQLADINYIEKCRDFLFEEFVEGGMTGASESEGFTARVYNSPEELVAATPNFIRWVLRERLEQDLNKAYHYASEHFGGDNLYMDAILYNYARLDASLKRKTGT